MTVNHGFHATMTAQPGKGADLVEFLLNAPSLSNEFACAVVNFVENQKKGNRE